MPKFSDLSDFLQDTTDEGLTLPINGKTYTFPPMGSLPIGQALKVHEFKSRTEALLRDGSDLAMRQLAIANEEQDEFTRELIGPEITKQLVAAGVTWDAFGHVASTLILFYLYGAGMAEQCWNGNLDDAAKAVRGGLGETSGPTAKSSTPTARTGSTPTKRRPSARGTRSKKPGPSSKPTS